MARSSYRHIQRGTRVFLPARTYGKKITHSRSGEQLGGQQIPPCTYIRTHSLDPLHIASTKRGNYLLLPFFKKKKLPLLNVAVERIYVHPNNKERTCNCACTAADGCILKGGSSRGTGDGGGGGNSWCGARVDEEGMDAFYPSSPSTTRNFCLEGVKGRKIHFSMFLSSSQLTSPSRSLYN